MPGYWMYEQSGALRPAVMAYLEGGEMTPEHIALMRAYLRQWINAPEYGGQDIVLLRSTVGSLTTRRHIERWLEVAERNNIDPL